MPFSMDHNEFSFEHDLIEPITDFFNRIEAKRKQQKDAENESAKETKGKQKDRKIDCFKTGSNPMSTVCIDELDQKRVKKTTEYITRIKNFEATFSPPSRLQRSYSEEDMFD